MNYISPRFYYQVLLDFFRFIKLPQNSLKLTQSEQSATGKIISSVFLLIIKFAFSISVASLIGLFYEPKNLTDQAMSERFMHLVYLAVGGLILPLFEELLFRLSLVFKPIYLSISLACATYYLLTKVVFGSKLSLVDDTFYIRVGIALGIGLISFLLLRRETINLIVKDFWANNFRWIYYASAIIFAWLHVFNFEPTLSNLLLTPILTLPQLFSGLISGYLRVQFGFIYPVLLHVCTNSLLIGLSILVE